MLRTFIYGAGFLLTVQLLGTALALQCYECSGPKGVNHNCEVQLGNVPVQNCTPGFVCTLFISTAENQSTIHRLCSERNECEVVQAKNTHLIGNVTVDICTSCETDYCNSAKSYMSSFSLSISLSVLSIIAINTVFRKF